LINGSDKFFKNFLKLLESEASTHVNGMWRRNFLCRNVENETKNFSRAVKLYELILQTLFSLAISRSKLYFKFRKTFYEIGEKLNQKASHTKHFMKNSKIHDKRSEISVTNLSHCLFYVSLIFSPMATRKGAEQKKSWKLKSEKFITFCVAYMP